MNKIVWHNRARKQMKKIPSHYREEIFNDVDFLATFPQAPSLDVKELKKHRYDYRLRVGRYRVMFDFDGGIKIVEIQEVKKRDGRTY